MIKIKRFIFNPLQVNCFVLSNEAKEGIIVDCACFEPAEQQQVEQYLQAEGIRLVRCLQTHMHFDHVMGLSWLQHYAGIQAECHAADLEIYATAAQRASEWVGIELGALPPARTLPMTGNELLLPFGESAIRVLFTPGHTPGGVCYYLEENKALLSGDTLFRFSVGRTDLPGGDYPTLVHSIRTQLLTLPPETTVYPGHGPKTSIAVEQHNPYVI